MNKTSEIHTLHRYFIWANRMKNHCAEAIRDQGEPPSSGIELRFWLTAPFCYACYWLATLHVIVEGMRELQLTNSSLTNLLEDEDNLNKLRRFRNGIYHYQKDYFDARIKDFLSPLYIDWANEIHDVLSKFFKDWYESQGLVADAYEDTNDRIRIVITDTDGKSRDFLFEALGIDDTSEGGQTDECDSE